MEPPCHRFSFWQTTYQTTYYSSDSNAHCATLRSTSVQCTILGPIAGKIRPLPLPEMSLDFGSKTGRCSEVFYSTLSLVYCNIGFFLENAYWSCGFVSDPNTHIQSRTTFRSTSARCMVFAGRIQRLVLPEILTLDFAHNPFCYWEAFHLISCPLSYLFCSVLCGLSLPLLTRLRRPQSTHLGCPIVFHRISIS
jgi:hypothetical protein